MDDEAVSGFKMRQGDKLYGLYVRYMQAILYGLLGSLTRHLSAYNMTRVMHYEVLDVKETDCRWKNIEAI